MGQQAAIDLCVRHDAKTGRWAILGCQGTEEVYPLKWCDTRELAIELARAERDRWKKMGTDCAIHVAGACPAFCDFDQPVTPTVKES